MGNAAEKLEDVQPETADPAVVVNLADYKHRRSRAARRIASGRSHLRYEPASDHGLYRYAAFGQTVEDTSLITQPLRWKARWFSPVAGGTYDVRARQWSPELGVFLSVDEFRYFSRSNPLWGWPGQNPLRYSDPFGRLAPSPGIIIAAGIAGGSILGPLGIGLGFGALGLASAAFPSSPSGPSNGTGPSQGSGGGLGPSPAPGAGAGPGDSGGGPAPAPGPGGGGNDQDCQDKADRAQAKCLNGEPDACPPIPPKPPEICAEVWSRVYLKCMGLPWTPGGG